MHQEERSARARARTLHRLTGTAGALLGARLGDGGDQQRLDTDARVVDLRSGRKSGRKQ